MLIITSGCEYEIAFQHAQVEVTGKCNMRCDHCRAWGEARVHLPIEEILKAIDFALSEADSEFRLTISGGEPFIRPDLVDIIMQIADRGIRQMIITTNGSLVTSTIIHRLEKIGIPNLSIQVSIDSPVAEQHDNFRRHNGAFRKAVATLRMVVESSLVASLRATITPDRIGQVNQLIDMAQSLGVDRVGIGSVIPAGKGKRNPELIMTPVEKRSFLSVLTRAKRTCHDLDVTTEDPLKFATGEYDVWDFGEDIDPTSENVFGGCTAGVTGFNVSSEGVITPCAVFLSPITCVRGKTVGDIRTDYAESKVIKQLLSREFSGKCGECQLKRICGGCRAVAFGINGDYMSSDVTCWRNG